MVLIDTHRLAECSEWGFYELVLTALIEACGQHPTSAGMRTEINALRHEIILSNHAILARRHGELAAHMLCQERGLRLCLVLDEFDDLYRNLPPPALLNLRALRDAHKYHLSYIVLLRQTPARLRPPADCEGFYELLSRTIIGLRPYTTEDADRIITQLEVRKNHILPGEARTLLLHLSGGHPGLLGALFGALADRAAYTQDDVLAWLGNRTYDPAEHPNKSPS